MVGWVGAIKIVCIWYMCVVRGQGGKSCVNVVYVWFEPSNWARRERSVYMVYAYGICRRARGKQCVYLAYA